MPSFTCPNDGSLMDSDGPTTMAGRARKGSPIDTHTCTECGYQELR